VREATCVHLAALALLPPLVRWVWTLAGSLRALPPPRLIRLVE
jgi:hypothetical protein